MKKIVLVLSLLVIAPLAVSSLYVDQPKPLPDSKAWQGYCECMNEDQIYFARSF